MEQFYIYQSELSLRSSLTKFGLNPAQWEIEFNGSPSKSKSQVTHITIRNKEDSGFLLKGVAQFKRLGRELNAQWLQISLAE